MKNSASLLVANVVFAKFDKIKINCMQKFLREKCERICKIHKSVNLVMVK